MFNHIHHDFPKLIQENLDGTRVYVTPTGEKYPSVTTVLAEHGKEAILEWRKRVGEENANKISRQATTRGTGVHKAIETYLKNEDISQLEMMPNVKSLFYRMKKELDGRVNNIHCLEEKLFSHNLKLAGTVDCVAEHDGVLSVIDFKTSIRLKKKENIGGYFMQGVAYAKMFSEMTDLEINKIVILIGVDMADFCQTLVIKKEDFGHHEELLQSYIDKYHKNNLSLV
jgi:genome maintenance exonuclease 1